MSYWHNTLFKPETRVIKNHPNRDLIRKEKSGTERTIATAASLYKRRARWKRRRWRILNGRVSIDFLFKKWEVNSALLRFLTVQWRNLPLIVYCLFQFKSFQVFFLMAMVSWVFQCRGSVSSSISRGLLPAEKCAILTDMTQGAVSLHHSICSAELPNLNPLRPDSTHEGLQKI